MRNSEHKGIFLSYKPVVDLYNIPWETFRGHFSRKYKGNFIHFLPPVLTSNDSDVSNLTSNFAKAGLPFTHKDKRNSL